MDFHVLSIHLSQAVCGNAQALVLLNVHVKVQVTSANLQGLMDGPVHLGNNLQTLISKAMPFREGNAITCVVLCLYFSHIIFQSTAMQEYAWITCNEEVMFQQ